MSYDIPIYKLHLVRDGAIKVPDQLIDRSELAAHVLREYLDGAATENLVVLVLDKQNKLIGPVPIASGGIDSVTADIGMILTPLFIHRGAAFIFGHNHPSGDPTPSKEDIALFRHLKKTGDMISRPMLDAIIVGDGTKKYYSFTEQACMTAPFLKSTPSVHEIYGRAKES